MGEYTLENLFKQAIMSWPQQQRDPLPNVYTTRHTTANTEVLEHTLIQHQYLKAV